SALPPPKQDGEWFGRKPSRLCIQCPIEFAASRYRRQGGSAANSAKVPCPICACNKIGRAEHSGKCRKPGYIFRRPTVTNDDQYPHFRRPQRCPAAALQIR